MKTIKTSGAKIILLSKLRAGPLSSGEIMKHLDSMNYSVSRVRVHTIIKELKAHSLIAVKDGVADIANKGNSKCKRTVMFVALTRLGCDIVTAYLGSDIGKSIDSLKERAAATITDADKEIFREKVFELESSLAKEIREVANQEHETKQGELICSYEKQQLIALENCCIESRKWLDKC
jgi:hypothetical protein